MTAFQVYMIRCNGCSRPLTRAAGTVITLSTAAEVRSRGKDEDWIHRSAMDFCPSCVDDGTSAHLQMFHRKRRRRR